MPTFFNIADIGTRPISVIELEKKEEWFKGPKFILEEDIPNFETMEVPHELKSTSSDEQTLEVYPSQPETSSSLAATVEQNETLDKVLSLHAGLKQTIRVFARVLTFIINTAAKAKIDLKLNDQLSEFCIRSKSVFERKSM